MSFTVTPKSAPNVNVPPTAQSSARDRAIAKLTEAPAPVSAAPQDSPVLNPSKVSPEEMTAIRAPSKASEPQETEQKDSIETSKANADTKAKEQSLSSQYALMARKEKAIRAKQQELKAQEDALKAKEAAILAKDTEYQTKYIPKDRLSQDTLGVLNELGISYDQLTSLILNQPNKAESAQNAVFQKLEAEIKALRESQEAGKKAYEQSQADAYKQAVSQIRNEVKQLVTSDTNFEAINATGSIKDVVDLIEKTFKEDGILLSVEDACKEVEDYLVDEAYKLSKLNKIRAKHQPQTQKPTHQASQSPQTKSPNENSQSQSIKTLTNAMSSTRPLSAKERAILAFNNKLSK